MVNPRRADGGSALVVAIAALAIAAIMIAVTAGLLRARSVGIRLVDRDVRTMALADAAMAEALARLAADREAEGVPERPFGHGTIRAVVDRSDRDRPKIEAVGSAGGWEVVLSAELRWTGTRPEVVRWDRQVRAIGD